KPGVREGPRWEASGDSRPCGMGDGRRALMAEPARGGFVAKLKIIIGSTRPGRAADRVAPWVIDRAGRHGAFEVEVLDLRAWPLPFFQETRETVGDFADPPYSDPIVRRWNRTIADGDAYLFI